MNRCVLTRESALIYAINFVSQSIRSVHRYFVQILIFHPLLSIGPITRILPRSRQKIAELILSICYADPLDPEPPTNFLLQSEGRIQILGLRRGYSGFAWRWFRAGIVSMKELT